MRKAIFTFLVLGLLSPLGGQVVSSNPAVYTPEQVDQLVAPIALYPDPLVALILPASTVPGDVVLAERYFEANGDPNQVDNQSWDDSVRALAHYPAVIKWMNDNLDWTTTLGRVFLVEPTQVMESVQQLRAQARANGALVDTPQQNVVMDGSDIDIVPAQPDSIYVPEYDPDLVFSDQPVLDSTPLIVFGPSCWVGPWLNFECDWGQYGVWIGAWRPGWDYLRDWRRPRGETNRGNYWRADPARQRAAQHALPRSSFAAQPRPQPMASAPRPAIRAGQTSRPVTAGYSSRADTTGWRTDASGHLAVTPAPAARPAERPTPAERPAGPQIILSTPAVVNRPAVAPSVENRPAPQAPAEAFRPTVQSPAAASGALFGGYSRGTEARDFSSRGQASIQAARPAVPAPRAMPSAPPPRAAPPSAPPPRSEPPPSSAGGNEGDQRKH